MLFQLGLSANKNSPSQIFESLFLITIFCVVLANPIEREELDRSSLDDRLLSAEMQSEREKVISEIKSKILSRLNYSRLPKFNKTFDWNSIPEEMKRVLNQEVMSEEREADHSFSNIETMITTLNKMNSCNASSTRNQQCLELTIPNLDNREIVAAKLIIPLTQAAFDNGIQGKINYNLTVNSQTELNCDLSISSANGESLTIDWTQILKTLLNDDDDFDSIRKVLSWPVTISGSDQMAPVDKLIDSKRIILEIHYKNIIKPVRKKRSVNTCQSNQFFCCTERLKVSIEDLGWSDFILAPRTFSINYCRGDCNNYITHSSNHARAVNAVRAKGLEDRRQIRSCCVPYSYSNLTIMYLKSDNSLAVATFNDLIASTCGCL